MYAYSTSCRSIPHYFDVAVFLLNTLGEYLITNVRVVRRDVCAKNVRMTLFRCSCSNEAVAVRELCRRFRAKPRIERLGLGTEVKPYDGGLVGGCTSSSTMQERAAQMDRTATDSELGSPSLN